MPPTLRVARVTHESMPNMVLQPNSACGHLQEFEKIYQDKKEELREMDRQRSHFNKFLRHPKGVGRKKSASKKKKNVKGLKKKKKNVKKALRVTRLA